MPSPPTPLPEGEGSVERNRATARFRSVDSGGAIITWAFRGTCAGDRMALINGAPAGIVPSRIEPLCPAHLIMDHSVQVDHYGSPDALRCTS